MSDAQVAGGHKANLNNPNTSEESKQHSREVLENEFNGGDGKFPNIGQIFNSSTLINIAVPKATDSGDKNPGNVAGGLKA